MSFDEYFKKVEVLLQSADNTSIEGLNHIIKQIAQKFLIGRPVSCFQWLLVARCYINYCKLISNANVSIPGLTVLADALLKADISTFDSEKEKETYREVCNFIRKINIPDDYGSYGETTNSKCK